MVEDTVSFEDIMASLDKNTSSQLRIGSQISRHVVPTASYKLNRLLDGGFRKGKQHTLWGGEQSGKTSFALQTVGINQKLGEKVAWIDAEHSFVPEWAYRLGVDPDRIAVSEVSTIGELTDLQVSLVRAGFDIIVIDSTGALMPKSYVDKDGDLKPFAETAQLGAVAKDLGQMCKMVQGINYDTAIIHISQARVDVGSPAMTKPFKPIGGKEVGHTDSLRVRFSASMSDAKAIMGKVPRGKLLVEEKIGMTTNWHIDKNKINGQYGSGAFDFYTGGSFAGLDFAGELLDEAIRYGVVESTGAWVTVFDEKFNGRGKALAVLRDDEALLEKLRNEIDEQSI